MTEATGGPGEELQHDDDLAAYLAEVCADLPVAGVSVGLVAGGVARAASYGVTDRHHPRDVDADTLFMVGSTSKTFTATALMALVDRGDLSLDDRVRDHLPDFRLQDEEVADTVTVRHLLNHTGGWRGDVLVDSGWGDDAIDKALDFIATVPQELPTGQIASYSNSGLIVAGKVVAVVAGTTFEQAVRDLVLTPLGLSATGYFPWEVAHRPHGVGHIESDGAPVPVPTYPVSRWLGPAGGLWSSVRDQLTYLRYHLDGTLSDGATAPLLEATRLAMQQPTVEMRSGLDGIGLAWLLTHHGDVPLVTHGGNVSNLHTSTFAFAPGNGIGVTVLSNGKHGAAIGAKVQAWALERYAGAGEPAALPTRPLPEADARELAGSYDLGPYTWSMTVDDDGRLFIAMVLPDGIPEEMRIAFTNPPRELVAVGDDAFALASSPTAAALDVRRHADGSVHGIVHGLRFAPRIGDGS